jgi:hypothetical protein
MLGVLLRASVLLLMSVAQASAAEEIKRDNIYPWEIEASFKNDKFDRCAISRKVDDVVASLIRTDDGLALSLQSANWKLDRGKSYPVRMKAGAAIWNTDVAAEASSVSVPIDDKRFVAGLRAANVLIVEGAGSTIRLPLDQSLVALERLDNCVSKNSRAVETNPFVAPPRQP